MSIILTIENDQNMELSIPISTEPFFNRCWKNVAMKYNLEYILSMQDGLKLDRTTVEYLIAELKQLSIYINIENFAETDVQFSKERLNFIIPKLETFLSENEGSIIGDVG